MRTWFVGYLKRALDFSVSLSILWARFQLALPAANALGQKSLPLLGSGWSGGPFYRLVLVFTSRRGWCSNRVFAL